MFKTTLIVFLSTLALHQAADYLCKEEFCSYYVEKNECMSTSDACKIQNRTYNGELFPGEVPCGCCEVCLQNLREGDPCTIGSPDVTPPMLVCGPGLYCQPNEINSELVCAKMRHTECFKEQIRYDENKAAGKIGSFMQRPRCDGDGHYLSAKCNVNQTCFCVNQNGKRIFGEMPYSTENELTMKCECSRMADTFSNTIQFEQPALTARCQEDGSFDPLQCISEKCVCIEPDSGAPSNAITVVTGSDYNRMPCFDRKMHLSYKYLHNCEEILHDLTGEIDTAENKQFAVFGYEFPKCQKDGWFDAVQKSGSLLICVDKYNQRLEDFEALSGTQEAIDMNCKCARTRALLKKHNYTDLPACTPNGNFEKIQCRNGMCYCIDGDGLQLVKEQPNASDLTC